ncbi:MAG: hypothetical protein PHP17_01160 [Candidatus Omnitrophica bacterium]|nr:hypothetical protein [Candidatus Omnitrophota bacterium]
MKKSIFLLGLFITASILVYGESPYDGNGWKLLNRYIEGRTMRRVLLQGIYEGAAIIEADKAKEVYSSGNYENIALMVDDFYSDDSNLSIPVTHAFYVVSMKLKNKPKAEIDEIVKKFRKGYRMQFIKPEKANKPSPGQ